MTKEVKEWWNTLDMNCDWLNNQWFKMYGSVEQRILQLYTIRNNLNFKKK